eukprot:8820785-Pyramimonas_sp.AAC.1
MLKQRQARNVKCPHTDSQSQAGLLYIQGPIQQPRDDATPGMAPPPIGPDHNAQVLREPNNHYIAEGSPSEEAKS